MEIIDKIKYIIGTYFLKKEIEKRQRVKRITNIADAKTIGILYELSDVERYGIISDFVKSLQDKQKIVKALGYIPAKIVPHYCFPKISFDFFTQKDLNWYYKPINKRVYDFINTEFDILIDLTTDKIFPLEYIATLSSAKFKTGRKDHSKADDKQLYDLMIDIEKNKTVLTFIKHIDYYLSIINKKNDQ
ncbi:MAG: hypothetical protein Q8880_08765 [Bacteroidota bacterium]|nr:hypothetical protein [Bacteroidota bacterium]